jgi:hypothetical protein
VVHDYKTVGCSVTGKLVLSDLRWLLSNVTDYPGDSVVEVHTGKGLPDGGRTPDILIVRPFPTGGGDGDLAAQPQAR